MTTTRTLAAAMIAAGSIMFFDAHHLWADPPADQPAQKTGAMDESARLQPGSLPPGIQKSTKDDSKDIQKALARTTDAIIAKKDLGDLVDHFVDADRNRIDPFVRQNKMSTDLAGRIEQIRNAWKAKYNQDFNVPEKVAFDQEFKGFVIVQGEIANPALLSNWPVPNGAAPEPVRDMTDRPGNKPGDRNLEKGRNVAVVTFPSESGLSEVNVSMIHELPDAWRIDVPDNVDGGKLQESLSKHLTEFGSKSDQWPADVNQAYRLAAHHVLMAIYDVSPAAALGADRMHE